jgi:hypothetical protein
MIFKVIGNCLSCGKINCKAEGEGPCLFCGNELASSSGDNVLAAHAINHESNEKAIDDLQRAIEHKNRLVMYDRESKKRTKVYYKNLTPARLIKRKARKKGRRYCI